MDLGRRNTDMYGRDKGGGQDPGSNNMPLQFSGKSGPKVIERSRDEDHEKKSGDKNSGNKSSHSASRRMSNPEQGPQMPPMSHMWEGGGAMGYQDNMMNDPGAMMMMGGGGGPMMPGAGPGPGYGIGPGFQGPMEVHDYMHGSPPIGPQIGPQMGPMMGPMMGSPYNGPMGPMGGQMGMGDPTGPRKPVLHFAEYTLFPPTVHQGPPPVGERPLGCKTIFVGGQPQNMTTEMMHELFTKHGGEIHNIRQGTRNFCHVRFNEEQAVDNAMFVSGYRVRIGANIDPENNGRLRVDFAENRDDQYEFECEQRRRAREARHAFTAPVVDEPAVTPRYSTGENSSLLTKLKDGETFPQAANMLVTWLERGECDKRNATQFFNLVKASHMHVRRLIGEKAQCDLSLNQIQQQYRMQVSGLITQYTLIEQVLMSACKQKASDHFTKAQRKNIQNWKQQTKELRQQQQDELGIGEKGEAEMELSDEDDQVRIQEPKRPRTDSSVSDSPSMSSASAPSSAPPDSQLQLQVQALMHQNNYLRNQLETLKAKEESSSSPVPAAPPPAPPGTTPAPPGTTPSAPPPPPTPPNEEMETQIKALQHSLLSMQQQLQDTKNKWKKEESMRKETEERLKSVETQMSAGNNSGPNTDSHGSNSTSSTTFDPVKADMIGLLSIFLHVHPFGASTEYLWSYMQRINPSVTINEIECLMNSYPTIFRQDLFGVGASLEKRWRYTVFSKFSDIKSGVMENNGS